MPARVLFATSDYDYDPSELAIPWIQLRKMGLEIGYATPSGDNGGADPRMLTGAGLGILKPILMARGDAVSMYHQLSEELDFKRPQTVGRIAPDEYDAIILPGGHAPGIRTGLESLALQRLVAEFFDKGKLVAAICHGTQIAARAKKAQTGESWLVGRTGTSLLKSQELSAWNLTRLWLGNYYRTYPGSTVEDEVRRSLGPAGTFMRGPMPLARDREGRTGAGFAVVDGNYISARWPGDCYRFAETIFTELQSLKVLRQK
jgi:putative intracellular protease/amidase